VTKVHTGSTDLTAPAAAGREYLRFWGPQNSWAENFFIVLAMCWLKNTAKYVVQIAQSFLPPMLTFLSVCTVCEVLTLSLPPVLTWLRDDWLTNLLLTCLAYLLFYFHTVSILFCHLLTLL